MTGIMKRTAAIAAFMLLAVLSGAQERDFDYVFFRNAMKSGMYPYSEVQYSGYSWVKNGRRHLFAREEQFSSPGNCLELTYKSNPAGNWMVKHRLSRNKGCGAIQQALCTFDARQGRTQRQYPSDIGRRTQNSRNRPCAD